MNKNKIILYFVCKKYNQKNIKYIQPLGADGWADTHTSQVKRTTYTHKHIGVLCVVNQQKNYS